MSLETCFGPELNIYEESPTHAKRLVTTSPVLSYKKLQSLIKNPYFEVEEFELSFKDSISLEEAISTLKSKVVESVRGGNSIIHLIEEMPAKGHLSINALLAVGAVHQELVRLGLRSDANIVCTSSSARDTHQIACLIGFGATAVYPTLAYQTILDLSARESLKVLLMKIVLDIERVSIKGF